MLTLAIATLTSMVYSQNSPIQRGGIVVYEKDGHGLVAAPTDLGYFHWESAKTACDTLTLNGYSDWRLPSKEELNQLYLKKDTIGGFESGNYWSSTDYMSNYAWHQYFGDGDGSFTTTGIKTYYVRAVRTF